MCWIGWVTEMSTSGQRKRITDYYAALNELASMLADTLIGCDDYFIQRNLLHYIEEAFNANPA